MENVYVINLFRGLDSKYANNDIAVGVVKGSWEHAVDVACTLDRFYKNAVKRWRELDYGKIKEGLTPEEMKEWERLYELEMWTVKPGCFVYASTANVAPVFDDGESALNYMKELMQK